MRTLNIATLVPAIFPGKYKVLRVKELVVDICKGKYGRKKETKGQLLQTVVVIQSGRYYLLAYR